MIFTLAESRLAVWSAEEVAALVRSHIDASAYAWTAEQDGPIERNRWMAFGRASDGQCHGVRTDGGSRKQAESIAAALNLLRSSP